MAYADPFALTNEEAEQKEKNTPKPIVEYQIEAYQIIKLRKVNDEHRRDILDTVMVYKGDCERARSLAIKKANSIGHCMVIEKLERVIHSADTAHVDSSMVYKPFRGRKN